MSFIYTKLICSLSLCNPSLQPSLCKVIISSYARGTMTLQFHCAWLYSSTNLTKWNKSSWRNSSIYQFYITSFPMDIYWIHIHRFVFFYRADFSLYSFNICPFFNWFLWFLCILLNVHRKINWRSWITKFTYSYNRCSLTTNAGMNWE